MTENITQPDVEVKSVPEDFLQVLIKEEYDPEREIKEETTTSCNSQYSLMKTEDPEELCQSLPMANPVSEISESNSSSSMSAKGKKGTKNSDQYQRNIIPDLKVNGLEYINYRREICPPRKTGDDCRCKNKNCFSLVDNEKQMSIIAHLNKLKNKDKQDIYLQGLIEVEQVKSRRPRKEIPKVRSNNYSYFIMVENKKINVCKRAFISLHGITEKRVRRLCLTLVKGESPCDLRQKHIKINKLFHEIFSKKLY